MQTGTVKWFSPEKGYGFIAPDSGGNDLFVHHSQIGFGEKGARNLQADQRVQFDVQATDKGPTATGVTLA